jgi:hypothetical protein
MERDPRLERPQMMEVRQRFPAETNTQILSEGRCSWANVEGKKIAAMRRLVQRCCPVLIMHDRAAHARSLPLVSIFDVLTP